MALPNPSMSFSPFAILTAEEMNDLVENIESLAAGTGFNTGAIPTVAIEDEAVTSDKIDFTTIPKFAVRLSSNQSIPSATGTKLAFNSVEYQQGLTFNTANNNFTVPVTGVWSFTVAVSTSAAVAGALYLVVNGVEVRRPYYTGSLNAIMPLSTDYMLTAGDVVHFQIYTASSSTVTSGTSQNWATGRLV